MKSIKLFLLLLVASYSGFGQENVTVQVEGKVMDSAKQAVESVNILLQKKADSSLVKAGISDKSGNFILRGIKPGDYLLVLSKAGYDKKYLPVTVGASKLEVPAVTLSYEVANLQGVTVQSKKPLVEQTDDKISYNVENDPLAAAETALDLLRKTPLVTVDGQGNIQVNGQSSFRVLLNGRETSMFARNVSEALKGFPGTLIKKIEVTTNPSAKYDGEGVGGIINIITKKKVAGYNGSISTTASTTGFRVFNASLNLKYGKFGLSGYTGMGGNFNQPNRSGEEIESKNPIAFYKRISSGEISRTNKWIYGNIELSYEIDSLNTLSSYFIPNGGGGDADGTSLFHLIRPNRIDTVTSIYKSYNEYSYPSSNIGLDYIRKFKGNTEKEFSMKLNADFGSDNTYSTSAQSNPGGTNRFIINDSKAVNRQYTIQTDYVQPLAKNQKLELGAKAIIRRATSDYQSLIKYDPSESYKINPTNTDNFKYNQNVYSLYTTYSFKINKVNFRTGVRMENTDLNGYFVTSATTVNQNYINFLPNLLVSTKFKKGQTLSFSYGMRIARPYIWNLNPFVNNTDSLNISTGNPALQPQTFNTFSLQYRFTAGQTFLSFGLTSSFSNDRIIQFSTFNDITGITTSSPANIGRNKQTSLSISVNGKFNPDWTINTNGSLAYEEVENTSSIGAQRNSGFSGNGFLNSNYNLTKKFAASTYIGFYLPPPTLQGRYGLNFYYGIGVNHKFLKDKLTVNLSAVNLHTDFFTQRNVFEDNNFKRTTDYSYLYRGLQCSISWSFGKLSENVSKKRGVTNDDLLSK
jgi:outer membrane receptor protein involved in Fe transport